MASPVSGISSVNNVYSVADSNPTSNGKSHAPVPNESEQMASLERQGESANQIAASLGLPVTLVDQELGLATTTDTVSLSSISIKP